MMKKILIALLLSCLFFPPLAMAKTEPTFSEADQAALLKQAAAWEVPQPQPGASMVKIQIYKSGHEDFYALGFVTNDSPSKILVGFDVWQNDQQKKTLAVPDPDQISLDNVSPQSPFSDVSGVNVGLITGIQLLRAGHTTTGKKLIQKSLHEESGHHRSAFHSPADESPVLVLARTCLAAAVNDITSTKPDFAAIKKRIDTILRDQPQLKNKTSEWLLEGLTENINHSPAQPGSIEAIIDDYLIGGGNSGALSMRNEISEAEKNLILKGFEAVPHLLTLRDSKRFTNHIMQGFNNFSSYPMSVGQVVNAYLQKLANDEMGSNWLDRQKGYTAENDRVIAWWKKAEKLGEKGYAAAYTIVPHEKDEVTLSTELLLIALDRYPDLLPDLYRKILKSTTSSYDVAEALVASSVPQELQIKLLNQAIASNHESHRNAALGFLQKLDPQLAEQQLIRLLNQAPKTTKGEYWTDQNASLGHHVSSSSNPKVWLAFHSFVNRADLGMQMELISNLSPSIQSPAEILQSYHDIYKKFSHDDRIRDEATSKKFSGPGAGFPYSRITMKDFIHLHWAKWLKLDTERPENDATASQWSAFRATVSSAVTKQIAK